LLRDQAYILVYEYRIGLLSFIGQIQCFLRNRRAHVFFWVGYQKYQDTKLLRKHKRIFGKLYKQIRKCLRDI